MASYYYTATATTTWANWTSSGTGTATSAWTQWAATDTCQSTSTTAYVVWDAWTGYEAVTTKESAEERRIRETHEAEERKERERLAAERATKEKAREKKARQLLREVLTEEQDKDLDKKGYFELISVGSGQKYRINKGRSRNINKLDKDGKVCGIVCFHPRDYLHDYDTMAAQKLMLEYNEEQVKKVANFS